MKYRSGKPTKTPKQSSGLLKRLSCLMTLKVLSSPSLPSNLTTSKKTLHSPFPTGWDHLPGKSRAFITHAIALLAANDTLIGADVISPFSDQLQIPEGRCFFGFQIMQRNIHAELFTVILEMFCKGGEEREYVFKTVSEREYFPLKGLLTRRSDGADCKLFNPQSHQHPNAPPG